MPCETDHQATIMTPIRRPPVLAVSQNRFYVILDSLKVQRFDRFLVVIVDIHRIRACAVLVKNIEVQRVRPPLGYRGSAAGITAVHDGAAANFFCVHFIHGSLHLKTRHGEAKCSPKDLDGCDK